MANVARLGDTTDHGGTVITASGDVRADGIGVARDGDLHSCPIPGHGVTAFSSSSTRKANGRSIVRTGIDQAGCGARVSSGSPTVKIDS